MSNCPPFIALIVVGMFPALSADAQDFDVDQIVMAEILPGWRAADGTHIAALHLTLAPGWKTYWRHPGEAGIPPEFNWQGSANLASVSVRWPVPEVFEINDLRSIGYGGDLVLPLEVTPSAPGQTVDLALTADLGICKDICVPLTLSLNAALLPGPGTKDPAIRAALANQPGDGGDGGISALTCQVEPIADGLRITAQMTLPATGAEETGVIELEGAAVWASPPELTRNGHTLRLASDLVPPEGAPFLLDRSQLRITVLGTDRAVEVRGCPAG